MSKESWSQFGGFLNAVQGAVSMALRGYVPRQEHPALAFTAEILITYSSVTGTYEMDKGFGLGKAFRLLQTSGLVPKLSFESLQEAERWHEGRTKNAALPDVYAFLLAQVE